MHHQPLVAWISEREAIRVRREAGQPKPWTDDPILQEGRFCNIRRENDRVTCWIAQNWREPHADDPELWFAMAVARLVNACTLTVIPARQASRGVGSGQRRA